MNSKKSTKKEMTLDDLALMVAKGFDEVNERMDKGFREVNEKIVNIESDIKIIKIDTENIKADLNKKVDRFEHKSLEYQVEKLQEKFA